MSDISVKFRGVRGSFPVADKNFLKYGGNTSCVEIQAGGHLIILDAGTGIVKVGDDLMEKYISSAINQEERKPIKASVLLSHIHLDHIMGLVFFKPLHVKSSVINLFGNSKENENLKDDLSKLVFGKTFPIDLGDISCDLRINNITKEGKIIFPQKGDPFIAEENYCINSEDVVVEFYKSYVHPQDGVMIYKIIYHGKSVVYATDKECFFGGDKRFNEFAKDCDLLIHDTQYTSEDYLNSYSSKQGYGHSTYDMAIYTMKQTRAKLLAFYHFDPDYNDEKLDKIKDYYYVDYPNVIMSSENSVLNI